jgi:arabinogalactan oligomer/maltooligosaccharide transport system substrate-binding protein
MGAGTLAATAALLLAGCGGSAESGEATASSAAPSASESAVASAAPSAEASASAEPQAAGDLTIWTEDYYVKIFEPAVKPWAEANGINVNFVTKDFYTMTDEFIAAVPAGEGPDLLIAPTATYQLVSNGVAAPVELGDLAAGFDAGAIAAVTQDGQIYGVPFTVENIALYRNTDLASTAPATFDEMIAAGNALVDEGKAKSAFCIGQDPKSGNGYLLMPFMSSFGSTIFAQDANGNFDGNQLTLDDAAGQEFAKWLGEAGASGALNPDMTLDIALQQFKDGECPFLVTGPWDLGGIKESGVNFAIDAIPTAGGEPAAPFVGNYGVYASSQAANPLAAQLFLTDFMTNTESQVAIWEGAQNPPALTAAFEAVADDPYMKAFGEIGAYGVPTPPIPAMSQVWGPWGETEVLIQRGKGDPVKLWKDMAEKIRADIAKM